ncbi:MAG TPA: TonB-dependent receptor, partial [Polyangiales bacterium]|nr:TonB-dependent receptor [Polyangiales bacterium]
MTRCIDRSLRWLGLYAVLITSFAHAQEAPAPDPNALTAPVLKAFVDAGYPEQARELKLEAQVLLLLTIGEDGFVEEVSQLGEPVGNGFDEYAVAAARRFVFEPATKGGVPLRARIQYRYSFTYQPPPEAAKVEEPAAVAQLALTIQSAEDQKPLENVEVIVTTPADQAFGKRIVTDANGKAGAELPPGTYELALAGDGFKGESHKEELTAGQVTELTYRLKRQSSYEEFGAVARVKAPPREVTRRTIEREELMRVAGTRGDALRTIELLPGVARPPFTAGVVLIRGSAPGDSQVLLDGVPVPLLYHFGGLTSFINSRVLDRIDFYPGNFSVRYGRAMGGIIDVGLRDPKTDKIHGVLDTNLPLDTSLVLEGPITEKSAFMVGGRRSYLGNILAATLPDSVGTLAAPVYYDYQGFVTYRPTDRDRLRIGAFGSSDRLKILFSPNDDDPSVQSLQLGTQFHRVQLAWRRQYSRKLEHDISFAIGREHNNFRFPPYFKLDLAINQAYLRAEWRYRFNEAVQLIVGTDSIAGFYDVNFFGPQFPDMDSSSNMGGSIDTLDKSAFDRRDYFSQLSGFIELPMQPIKALRVIPGLRLDHNSLTQRFAFDPRLSAVYSVTPAWRVKGGVGVFSQPPDPPQVLKGFGNPDLLYNKAIHYSLGFEHDFSDEYSLNIEGFYKTLRDRPVTPDSPTSLMQAAIEQPPYVSEGIGRVKGLEVAGRKQAKGRWFGFLSYTLMKSERKDPGEPWRPFNYDQRHIFTLAGNVILGRGWETGGVIRIVTGSPRTPVAGATQSLDNDTWQAADGRLNSARAPTFNRIDLRVEKKWVFDSWRIALYLDV